MSVLITCDENVETYIKKLFRKEIEEIDISNPEHQKYIYGMYLFLLICKKDQKELNDNLFNSLNNTFSKLKTVINNEYRKKIIIEDVEQVLDNTFENINKINIYFERFFTFLDGFNTPSLSELEKYEFLYDMAFEKYTDYPHDLTTLLSNINANEEEESDDDSESESMSYSGSGSESMSESGSESYSESESEEGEVNLKFDNAKITTFDESEDSNFLFGNGNLMYLKEGQVLYADNIQDDVYYSIRNILKYELEESDMGNYEELILRVNDDIKYLSDLNMKNIISIPKEYLINILEDLGNVLERIKNLFMIYKNNSEEEIKKREKSNNQYSIRIYENIEPNELVKIIKYCSPEHLNKELEIYNTILNVEDDENLTYSVPFKRVKMVENLNNCIRYCISASKAKQEDFANVLSQIEKHNNYQEEEVRLFK